MKRKAIVMTAAALSFLFAAGVVFGQTATPTTSPTPKVSPTTTSGTTPSSAPATGFGG